MPASLPASAWPKPGQKYFLPECLHNPIRQAELVLYFQGEYNLLEITEGRSERVSAGPQIP